MQTEQDNAREMELPFSSFVEFQEGHKTGRFLIGMYHRLKLLIRALPISSSLFSFPLIFSPFILAVAFASYGLWNQRFWLLLAFPVAWFDYRTSTGSLNAFRLLLWFPLALVGLLIHPVFASLGAALKLIGFAFIGTSLLCSAGLGTAKLALETRVSESESLFWSNFDSGLIFLFDTSTGRTYERPR